ncbi:MAG: PP2C family serine/threonine-protein phosphatase [Sandaracinaceae bacterium]
MRIEHEGRSDVGRRSNNEDGLLALPEQGLYAVADGMGGYEGGEVASRVALASLQSYFELLGDDGLGMRRSKAEASQRMTMAIRIADREVARRAVGPLRQMGTTLASIAFEGDRVLIAHVGDSRVYRVRDGKVKAMTRDHSLYAQMEAAGVGWLPKTKSAFSMSNVITQALGQGAPASPDIRVDSVRAGDRFLLCTDGFSDVIDDRMLEGFFTGPVDAERLTRRAYDLGSLDNITALLVTVGE